MQAYTTIAKPASAELTEKRSRFLCKLVPVSTPEEAQAVVAAAKEQHWDARHNCYAYVLRQGQQRRYSDDGEPQGTAGVPMLDVLQKSGLVDVVAVVTRYFGGVLLGAGGLVRAYSQAVAAAVAAAQHKTMVPAQQLRLEMDYGQYGRITNLLPRFEAETLDSVFAEQVQMELVVPLERLPAFCRELEEATSATVVPQLGEQSYHFFGNAG